ncbi:peroxiredoxin [Candidatus Kaiserbacteria bacterium RIFCSPHIGHO2_02_FULL_49_11]|uniref:Glutathione-dependent peroxiredoxin n=1 Tax=Candidatus Kaiserbacteria bacterium RIFCSPHIGHO2_02_FULL_49_11 TaxID=1798489 RepID=A0A1F6D0A8_9BACT|nr:MAG: peroxiredoxin [Candidatus Kaiserbacteria bacterium RIFCSPHIGHO2_02_FULL_49_11]
MNSTEFEKQLEGKQLPSVVLKMRVKDEGSDSYRWEDISTSDLFKGKNIVLFGLPGAFTPTCSSTHLPGYESIYGRIREAGVDEVYCISVNDAFVMNEWGKQQNVSKVKLLPDGSGLFTKEIEMLVKKNNLGFGDRSWRYSVYAQNGVIKKAFVEPGFSDDCPTDPFEVSDAPTMVKYLEEIEG